MSVDVTTLGWGTVLDRNGTAQTNVPFTLVDVNGDTALSGSTDANGQIAGSLASGTYTLTLAGESVTVDVPVTASETVANVKAFGALGDGATFDTVAIQAAIDSLPSTGGVVEFPPTPGAVTTYYIFDRLNLDNKINITLRGSGGPGKGTGAGTMLLSRATGASPVISALSVVGLTIEHLDIRYSATAGSFTGHLIDLRNTTGSGANDTREVNIESCFLGANPTSLTSAASLVRCNNSHTLSFRNTTFFGATQAVWGMESNSDYVNTVKFDRCVFEGFASPAIKNGGGGWTLDTCTFEGLTNGKAGAWTHDTGVRAGGLTVIGGWWGDVTVSGNPWIKWLGDGLVIEGAVMHQGVSTSPIVQLDENTCNGITILPGNFNGASGGSLIDFGATSGHTGVLLSPGELDTIAITAGTVPDGSIVHYDNAWYEIGTSPAPSLSGSWVYYGSGVATPAYKKKPDREVVMKGIVKSGTVPSAIVTLPTGFRPPKTVSFGSTSGGAFAALEVGNDGVVTITAGANTSVSLSNIRFQAA